MEVLPIPASPSKLKCTLGAATIRAAASSKDTQFSNDLTNIGVAPVGRITLGNTGLLIPVLTPWGLFPHYVDIVTLYYPVVK